MAFFVFFENVSLLKEPFSIVETSVKRLEVNKEEEENVLIGGNDMCKGPVAAESLLGVGAWEEAKVAGMKRVEGKQGAL